MAGKISIPLISQAAVPSVGLVAIGLAWLYWGKPAKAITVMVFSLGVALLTLMLLVVSIYSTALEHASDATVILILGMTLVSYVASLFFCQRRANISPMSLAVLRVLGLAPLWFLGGFVLMNSVCSFGNGGASDVESHSA